MQYGNKIKYQCNKCGRTKYYYKEVANERCSMKDKGCKGIMMKMRG